LQYYDNVSLTFTDTDHELKSDKGESIDYGTTLNFKIAPLIDQKTASRVDTIGTIVLSMVGIAFTIAFVLAIFRGSLLSTWLCINTM
jgi:hypothetical protein